jgi:L-ascorbate metabolism protein UlaG (beta-lactamase superfamily)
MKKFFAILLVALINTGLVISQSTVNLTWIGQSTFLMITGDGVKVLIDPVNPSMSKVEVPDNIDLVTISHEHGDHNYVALAKGNPVVIHGLRGSYHAKVDTVFKGVHVYTVGSFHDNQGGSQRGKNAIFVFELPRLRVVHLGDLGHQLNESQISAIGVTDILMIPVGTGPTIDLQSAMEVIKQLKPGVVIPMHYMPADAPAGGFRLGTVEDFIKAVGTAYDVKYAGHSETFIAGKVPSKTTITVMKRSD